jgi:hypothetical protein
MIEITVKLLDEYDIRFENRCRIFVDGANPSFIRALKDRVDEDTDYEQQIAYYKRNYPSVYDLEFLQQNMCDSCILCQGTQAHAGPYERCTSSTSNSINHLEGYDLNYLFPACHHPLLLA